LLQKRHCPKTPEKIKSSEKAARITTTISICFPSFSIHVFGEWNSNSQGEQPQKHNQGIPLNVLPFITNLLSLVPFTMMNFFPVPPSLTPDLKGVHK
jgi:hypothetical protein